MRISEVSKELDLSADTIRYYEKIGLIPPVTRNESKVRDFGEKDLVWLNFVKCMRASGLSIDDVITYVSYVIDGEDVSKRLEILTNKRDELVSKINELEDNLDYLNTKIDNYENGLYVAEEKIK